MSSDGNSSLYNNGGGGGHFNKLDTVWCFVALLTRVPLWAVPQICLQGASRNPQRVHAPPTNIQRLPTPP